MSLQVLAQDMASRGRGPDTMLVHMAPKEVAGLQALALAHGGSLTINPQTGLPEAGFLSAILPMVAGMALNAFAPGVGTAVGSALGGLGGAAGTGILVGGLTGLATGSLRKGLMAGLGAYGGAGIGDVIGNAGAAAIEAGVPATTASVAPVVPPVSPVASVVPPVSPVAPVAPVAAAPASGVVVGGPIPPPSYLQGAIDPTAGFPSAGVPVPASGAYNVDPFGGLGGAAPAPVTPPPALTSPTYSVDPAALQHGYTNQMDIASDAASAARETAARNYTNQMDIASDLRAPKEAALREAGPTGRFSKGLGAIANKPSLLFNKENIKYGLAAAAPLMFQTPKSTQAPRDTEQYRYAYSPGREMPPTRAGNVGEYTYFQPSYTRLAADGGLMDLPVQRMSDRNEAETEMANGGMRFADGGDTDTYNYAYDPVTRTYTKPMATPVRTTTQMPGVSAAYPNDVSPGAPGEGNTAWGELTPSQQAAYYAEHPTMSAITQFGQGLFGFTTPGMIQNALVPNFVQQQQMIAKGIDPFGMAGLTPQQQSNVNQALSGYLESSMNQAPGDVTTGFDSAGFGSYGENVAPGAGVEVGGPISSGDVTGVDIGSIDAGAAAGADAGGVGDAAGDGGGGDGADYARGGLSALMPRFARGGYNLGDYSDGGRLLRGPGDGVSDSIPASIANKRPARLADGEFVVPARIVSELGNGSTEAGARKLYAMMDRIQNNRRKTVGKGKVAVNSRSEKLLPA